MDTSHLEAAGLTKQEAATYLGLLTLEEAQTGRLCEETGIASSNIYRILERLQEKGLVSYRVQNNIKIFQPAHPEALNELFQKKQERLEQERQALQETIKQLKTKPKETAPESNYKYYEGIAAIKSMWIEINEALTPTSFERIYGAKKQAVERFLGFYDEHHTLRAEKKAKARIIIPKEMQALKKKRENTHTKVKVTALKNEAEWGVVDDYVYIQYITTKNPRAFLIKDAIFAHTLSEVFDKIWNT